MFTWGLQPGLKVALMSRAQTPCSTTHLEEHRMNIFEISNAVYTDHILAAGQPGDVVKTSTVAFIGSLTGADRKTALKIRKQAIDILVGAGLVVRVDTRGTNLRITRKAALAA